MGPERPRRHPARRPRRAGEEPHHAHPRAPEGPRGEPGYETADRRHGSVHREVLRARASPRPRGRRALHRLRPRRRPAEVLRRGRRLRDCFAVRDPGARRARGARLRPARRGRELPRDPGVRPGRPQRRALRSVGRARLRRRDRAVPPGPGSHAGGGPRERPPVLHRAVHAAARAGVRAPPGRVRRMAPRISVIVPTWNEAKYLPALLASLQAQTAPPLEVIVADSGSTDGTPDLARAAGALVLEGGRKGPGEGRNRGARAARGDVLLFVDADCTVPPELLSAVEAALARPGALCSPWPMATRRR